MKSVNRRRGSAGRSGWTRLVLAVAYGTLGAVAVGAARAEDKTDRRVIDIAEPLGFGTMTVEGVGLVINLAGTGSDPRPSPYRQKLETEIKRNPALNPDRILADPDTALVVVRANLTVGISPQDELNVEVLLPPGSEATSLEGGYLMETTLHQVGMGSGAMLEGQPMAKAIGAVMVSEEDPKAGQVLGGGRIRKEIPWVLLIADTYRSGGVAKRLQDRINYRFQVQRRDRSEEVATAKTDNTLTLEVPRRYHHNQLRYLQVVSQLPLMDNPTLRERRLEEWGEELLDPKTAGDAALKLEGIGANAAPVLAKGLQSDHPQVRFLAAEALAYLDDPTGVDELTQAAIEEPEFRALALAALASMDEPAGIVRLRELMANPDPEVRYGAFNALRATHPTDPYLGRVRVLGPSRSRPKTEEDPFALKFGTDVVDASDFEQAKDPFELYVVPNEGPPMVHVSRSRRPEIVLFGRGHQLLPPVVLGGTGPVLLNAGIHDNEIEITRIDLGRLESQVLRSSTDLVEVIRSVAKLGATYPRIVSILETAEAQANLTGPLLVDAVPTELESYDRAVLAGEDVTKKDESVAQAGLKADEAENEKDAAPRRRLLPRLFDGGLFGSASDEGPSQVERAGGSGEAAFDPEDPSTLELEPVPTHPSTPVEKKQRKSLIKRIQSRIRELRSNRD